VRSALPDETRAAARQGGSAVTSMAVFFLILAPALVIVTGAEALPYGSARTQPRPNVGNPAIGQRAAAGSGAAARHAAAGVAAPHGTGRRASAADGPALRLLQAAASADRTVSYEGVQLISWWSPDAATTVAVDVTHQSRQGTLVRTVGAGTTPDGHALMAGGPGAQPGDVLGVTEETLDLLSANYRVVLAGAGSACDRPTTIVAARRSDGTLAARFSLDDVTRIPLRRELFDHRSRMINESTFVDFRPGLPAVASPATAATPWNVLTAADLKRLRAAGWPLPANLPGGLVLFDARQAATPSGRVFQLGYSDGLSGVSLFVQRGGLPRKLAGWKQVEVAGRTVYARDPVGQGISWSSPGYVLTLIADAPAATISAAVRALPYDAQRGFWSRLGHGFGRVVSWVDPFR
jgi:hypothetical protein